MAFVQRHPDLRRDVLAWLARPAPTDYAPLSASLGRLMAAGQRHAVDTITSAVDLQPAERALEIGCGTGHALEKLANERRRQSDSESLSVNLPPIVGVDISATAISMCRQRLEKSGLAGAVALLCADVAAGLPLPANSFDVIFHLNSIYFWQPLDAALGECWRVLRPGGRMVTGIKPQMLSQVLRLSDVWRAEEDEAVFRHREEAPIAEALARAGFEATDVVRDDALERPGQRFVLLCHRKPHEG